MKACVLYFSQTGNTKSFAEEISDSLDAPVFDLITSDPSVVNEYDVVLIGTPVHGFNPSKEALAFVERLPEGDGKKTVLFCTHRLWTGRTFGKLKSTLKKKNYHNVLCVAVKGKEFSKEDFTEPVQKIVKKLQE
ncbi:MAG: flavodoxin domain-containing protein [Candidatus Bathyarchaeota archaeon]|nr:flavodoxin domain-containing protein [Candidatus Bathyarchaeota archaeon]